MIWSQHSFKICAVDSNSLPCSCNHELCALNPIENHSNISSDSFVKCWTQQQHQVPAAQASQYSSSSAAAAMDCQAHGGRVEGTAVNVASPGDHSNIYSSPNSHSSHGFSSGIDLLRNSTSSSGSGGSAQDSSVKECGPSLAAARAHPGGRAVVGAFYNSGLATRMQAATLADSASPSGFEEGADGVEVFQNVTHSIGISMFRWVSSCQPVCLFATSCVHAAHALRHPGLAAASPQAP